MKIKKILNQKVEIHKLINGSKHYYFGYYGKSPWNHDGNYAIVLETDFIDRHPSQYDSAGIILINCKTGKKKKIAETKTWNWQQGCMIQWMPKCYGSKIIFNDRKNGKFISRILDVESGDEKIINSPIYDIHPSGKYALSISYERLNLVREGYGYSGFFSNKFEKNIPETEGIYMINLMTGDKKLIINLKSLINFKNLKSMESGLHWVDQPIFNTCGDRLCFLHRWSLEGGLFHTRFFSIDFNGENIFMFPDSGFYSHFAWKNSKEILMFCSLSEKFGKLRGVGRLPQLLIKFIRPIYKKIFPRFIRKKTLPIGYYLLKDKSRISKKINIYDDDGHPSFSKNKRFILTDTYPNSKNYRKLILYDSKKHKRIILGNFYSLPSKSYLNSPIEDFGNSPFRVDLHPRWSFDNSKICFDSIHEGKRGVYFIELNDLWKN